MAKTPYASWMRTGLDAWTLGLETSAVIGMRIAKCASGGDLDGKEARLMVAEKVASALTLQSELFGLSPLAGTRKALGHYRRKVSANRRRLSRGH